MSKSREPIRAGDPDSFEEELWMFAKRYASSLGFAFEIGCEHNFRQLARASFVRVTAKGDSLLTEDVRANTETLVAAMITEARAHGATTLHEWTLQGALARLCPLYPFC